VRKDFDPVDKFSMRGPMRYRCFKTWSRGSVCSSSWLTPNSPRSTAWRHIFEPLDLESTINNKLEKRLCHPQNGQMLCQRTLGVNVASSAQLDGWGLALAWTASDWMCVDDFVVSGWRENVADGKVFASTSPIHEAAPCD